MVRRVGAELFWGANRLMTVPPLCTLMEEFVQRQLGGRCGELEHVLLGEQQRPFGPGEGVTVAGCAPGVGAVVRAFA